MRAHLQRGAPDVSSAYGTLSASNGGTGQAGGYAVGDLLYASAAGTLSKLAAVAAGKVLISAGVTTAPAWGNPLDVTSFRAYNGSAQTVSTSTDTKLVLDTESWDKGGWFDSATNYRYTPLIAGTYRFSFKARITTSVAAQSLQLKLYKNGASVNENIERLSGTASEDVALSALVEMNGTTDYVEFYVRQTTGSDQSVPTDTKLCWAEGARIC